MNHSRFRRFVSLLLAVLVFTASVGLTVQRHSCRFSKRSRLRVALAGQAPRGCGGERVTAAAARIKSGCCFFSSQLHKLSAPAQTPAKLELPGKALLATLPVALSALTAHVAIGHVWPAAVRWRAAHSSPPPLAGRRLLTFVCTLLV